MFVAFTTYVFNAEAAVGGPLIAPVWRSKVTPAGSGGTTVKTDAVPENVGVSGADGTSAIKTRLPRG
jgi:hypothetical protein